MRSRVLILFGLLCVFTSLLILHLPLLRLPYFWDEAGYYIPAALDFYRSGLLIPQSTLPTGHTPLVMVYLGLMWHVFGFSTLVTRAVMILVAAATVASVYALGRSLGNREIATWSAVLLGLSPLFFAQSSLAHLDLAAALFTTLAILALLQRRLWVFAVTASLAALSKETAVVLLPVAWIFAWHRGRARQGTPPKRIWIALTVPLLPLAAWAAYYHHTTGYWTGNREYLAYNFYSTLIPGRIFWSLLRRLYEIFIGGFNWLLAAGAVLGAWWGRKRDPSQPAPGSGTPPVLQRDFLLLAGGLTALYVGMLSAVGGAILPRYLLPVFPPLILAAVMFVSRLLKPVARAVCTAAGICFVWAWFLNPPYPFPFEDNLAYADFARLHQQAARFLESLPSQPRILTAWPASDELTRPFLGYVRHPLRVVSVQGFTADDFKNASPEYFDYLYLYSRKWEPRYNWLVEFPQLPRVQEHYFDYGPQVDDEVLVARFKLKLLAQFKQRGQWVRIYSKQSD